MSVRASRYHRSDEKGRSPLTKSEGTTASPTEYTEERLMTVSEVAAFLQVAEIFVYRHAKEMGASKVGSHLRFRRSRVEEWLDERVIDDASPECRPGVDNELMDRLAARVRRTTRT